jgi:hypothetical protein
MIADLIRAKSICSLLKYSIQPYNKQFIDLACSVFTVKHQTSFLITEVNNLLLFIFYNMPYRNSNILRRFDNGIYYRYFATC